MVKCYKDSRLQALLLQAATLTPAPGPQQADESEAAATSSASEAAPHGLAEQARGGDAACTSPSEHADAHPSAALPATAQQSNQGAATPTAAETADAAASHAQERAAADSVQKLPASTTASLHTELMMPDLPGKIPSCNAPQCRG